MNPVLRTALRGLAASAALLLCLAMASPAIAAPITLFFDGPTVGGEHKGIDDPTAALAAGVPLITPDLYQVGGVLDVTDQSADGIVLSSVDVPLDLTSTWTIQNVLATPTPGEVFLVFAEPQNRSIDAGGMLQGTSYLDPEVGLTIDPMDGWVIVEADDPVLGTFYYIGISLGTLLENPGALASVDVRYHLLDPETFADGDDLLLALPEMQILMGYVIPEPSTVLLLGGGLVWLGARRRGRN